jgi:hypothetical protein
MLAYWAFYRIVQSDELSDVLTSEQVEGEQYIDSNAMEAAQDLVEEIIHQVCSGTTQGTTQFFSISDYKIHTEN